MEEQDAAIDLRALRRVLELAEILLSVITPEELASLAPPPESPGDEELEAAA